MSTTQISPQQTLPMGIRLDPNEISNSDYDSDNYEYMDIHMHQLLSWASTEKTNNVERNEQEMKIREQRRERHRLEEQRRRKRIQETNHYTFKPIICTRCRQLGHMRTNQSCPKYNTEREFYDAPKTNISIKHHVDPLRTTIVPISTSSVFSSVLLSPYRPLRPLSSFRNFMLLQIIWNSFF